MSLFTSNAQPIRDAIDVIEPRRNQVDLQDCAIVETDLAQPVDVLTAHARRLPRQISHVVQHGPIGRAQLRLCVI